jgi:hypothetical protein
MGELISFIARKVEPRGLSKAEPDEEKVKAMFFKQDYDNFALLDKINVPEFDNPSLFYPGSGSDILFPLMYLDKLFPNLSQASLTLLDLDYNFGLIKTILDDVGIGFSETRRGIKFYWKNMLISLQFIQCNAFEFELPPFDIYFERAFRIMKERDLTFEKKVFLKLTVGGLLISDSGFAGLPLKYIEVPKELSGYKEMVMGIK